MKNYKKTIFASALALIVCCTLLLGSTFAWFTDSATNKGNVITSGEMDAGFYYKSLVGSTGYEYVKVDENTAVFEDVIWEPGKSYGYDFKVRNDGDTYGANGVAFNYQIELLNIQNLTDGVDMASQLKVYVTPANADTEEEALTDANYVGTLAEISENGGVIRVSDKVMRQGWEDTFSIVIKMDENAGNDYQNASVSFDIRMNAKQATFEEDAFGNNNYDANATYAD